MREEVIFFIFCVVFASAYVCEDGTIKNSKRKRWCTSERVYRMKGANCYDRDFASFPRCLRSDVEVSEETVISKVRILQNLRVLYYRFLCLLLTYLPINHNSNFTILCLKKFEFFIVF